MHKFCEKGNLPEKAGLVLLGEMYYESLKQSLGHYGIKVLPIPANPYVDKRLSSHADLSVFHAGGEKIFLAPFLKGTEFAEKMHESGFNITFCDIIQGENYPNDAALNICSVGDNFIFNPKVSCQKIINELKEQGREGIITKQGYCKCSVCIVDEKSIISSDKGICKAWRDNGLDALEIEAGFIELKGFDYGFIGGAAFKLGAATLAFTGSLDAHPDKTRILEFLYKRSISPVFLTELPVFDIGSAIPVLEINS